MLLRVGSETLACGLLQRYECLTCNTQPKMHFVFLRISILGRCLLPQRGYFNRYTFKCEGLAAS